MKAGRDPAHKERISMRLAPVIGQRYDGISKEAVEQHQDRQALISFPVNRVMGSSRKKELEINSHASVIAPD